MSTQAQAQHVSPDTGGPCSGSAATITYTAPTQGQSLAPGVTTVNVTGTVTNLHSGDALALTWYLDGNSGGTLSAGNFSLPLSGLSVGSHQVEIFASEPDAGCTGTFSNHATLSFTIVEAAPPTITMSASPTSTTAPGTVALSASPVSAATISKVDYLVAGSVIGTVTASPWSYSWTGSTHNGVTGITPGTYSVTARATDQYGQQGTSSPTAVTVNPAAAPTVSVTAVSSCAILPATITMNATVTSSYTVSSLNFIVNGTTYPVTAGATGSYLLPVPTTGGWGSAATYAVSATAANAWSSTGTSNTVNVAEAAHPVPTITLNSVETTDDVPAEIAVSTTPSDTVCGTNYISSVQLTLNGQAQTPVVTEAPYNFLVSGAQNNTTYTATVQATNGGGQTSAVSAPQSVTTPSGDPTISGDSKSQTRTTKYEYDPTIGRRSKTIVEPESSDLCLVTSVGYDSSGMPNTMTTRNCNGSTPNEASAPTDYSVFAARTTTMTADATETFLKTKTNALSQSSSTTYNAAFGTPTSQTDANGLSATATPDLFGRTTQVTAPDGTISKTQYLYCSGINGGTTTGCPSYGAYLIQTTAYASNGTTQIGATKTAYFDTLGRPIQSQTQGFSGTAIIATTSYDARGHVSQTSVPYYSSGTPSYSTTTYDKLNRRVQTTGPTGSTFTYSYNGVEITKTDGYNRSFTRTIDSRGEVISVVDPAAQVSTYQYDPFGNMILMADPQGVTKTLVYDLRGRKTSMLDPDMGGSLATPVAWTYLYDSASDLVSQTDAKGQTSTIDYDVLGRMISRTEPDLTSNWEYDVARSECTSGAGKAIGLADRAWTNNNYSRIECVDSLERPVQERTTIGSSSYVSSVAYNANSQPITSTYPAGSVYPSGFSVTSAYNTYGYLTQKSNTASGALIWQATAMDALGDVTGESMAAGAFKSTKTYDVVGRLTASTAGASNAIQNDSFVYDQTDGDLTSRGWEDNAGTQYSESFGYDPLDRLASVTGPSNKTFAYDYSGNFTSKSDVGTYAYNPGTHQVSSIAGTVNGVTNPTFVYDNNGNLTSEDGVTTTWSSFNMATSITRGSASDTFIYNSEYSRAKEVAVSSSGTVTTYYVSPSFEVVSNTATGTTEYHNYIGSSSRRVAMLIDSTASTTSWRYFHQDQVGSIDVVTDQTGAIVERLSYDAFGRRRNTNGTDSATFMTAKDSYGYTDQEELDNIGLINMNGRIYDPTIARFMSADPTISRPFDLQSHNRYSYVSNRPFVSIDPTGFDDTQAAGTLNQTGGGMCVGCQWIVVYGPLPGQSLFPGSSNEFPPGGQPPSAGLSTTPPGVDPSVGTTSTAPPADPSVGQNLNAAAPSPINSDDANANGTGQPASATGPTGAGGSYGITPTAAGVAAPLAQPIAWGSEPMLVAVGGGSHDAQVMDAIASGNVQQMENLLESLGATGDISPEVQQALADAIQKQGLANQLAIQEAASNGQGTQIMQGKIVDPAYSDSSVWGKMQYIHQALDSAEDVVVHYWQNFVTNVSSLFKTKP